MIMSTLIAFTPGELSTFAAPLDEWLYGMQPGLTSYIVPYNFADLPCPPYKTMVSLGPALNSFWVTNIKHRLTNGTSRSVDCLIVLSWHSPQKS